MRHAVQRFTLLVLLAVATACHWMPPPGDPSAPPPPETTLQVTNQNYLDMTLYVTNGTHRLRLGLVPGSTTRTFTIPPHLLLSTSALGFQADPIGGNASSVSEAIQVRPGEHIGLTLR